MDWYWPFKKNLNRAIVIFNFCISRKVDYCCFLSPKHPFVTQLLTRKLMIELLDMANNPDLHHPSSPEENEEVRGVLWLRNSSFLY